MNIFDPKAMRKWMAAAAVAALFNLTSCGNSSGSGENHDAPKTDAPKTEEPSHQDKVTKSYTGTYDMSMAGGDGGAQLKLLMNGETHCNFVLTGNYKDKSAEVEGGGDITNKVMVWNHDECALKFTFSDTGVKIENTGKADCSDNPPVSFNGEYKKTSEETPEGVAE